MRLLWLSQQGHIEGQSLTQSGRKTQTAQNATDACHMQKATGLYMFGSMCMVMARVLMLPSNYNMHTGSPSDKLWRHAFGHRLPMARRSPSPGGEPSWAYAHRD